MPQRTKLNPWKNRITKHTILALSVHDTGHSVPVVELIWTLQWVTLNESVFVLTQYLLSSHDNCMTKPKISYHLTFYDI